MSESSYFTPEQYARQRALDKIAADRAADTARRRERAALLREEREERGRPLTNAEAVRRHVALTNELGTIPAIADPARREACKYDFPLFVRTYGRALIKFHMPPPSMVENFLIPLQNSVLNGGQMLVEIPRGVGKTTFIDLCVAWAIAYGHRKFVVLISATGRLAKVNLANIMAVFASNDFAADFPEIASPIRALSGKWQMCESQTYLGQRTLIETKTDHVRMPTLVDAAGNVLGDAAGAIIYSVGVGGAVRGLNEGGLRPDIIFFDDIQKRKDAKSATLSEALEGFVREDAMGLFGHGTAKTALMALTPICVGDFASLMTDKERNPAWISIVLPFVMQWPSDLALVDEFCAHYAEDMALDDFACTTSRRFYLEHQAELNDGVKLLDPLVGSPDEYDALHHILIILATIGREAFDSEFQMRVKTEGGELSLDVATVKHALNGYPEFVVPDECQRVVAFCDVNIKAESGLRFGFLAIGSGNVCALPAYLRYPAKGRLYPEGTPPNLIAEYILEAVQIVGQVVAGRDVRRRDGTLLATGVTLRTTSGKRVPVSALGFDGGNWTRPVSRAVRLLNRRHKVEFPVIWSVGRGSTNYNDRDEGVFGKKRNPKLERKIRGDHMYLGHSTNNGEHLVVQTHYWREIAQGALMAAPLSDGSVSLWGKDPTRHDEFAREVCAERLVYKRVENGRLIWKWVTVNKRNHWCDVVTGCFVIASWFRFYQSVEQMVNRAAVRVASAADAPRISADRAKMEAELQAYIAAHSPRKTVSKPKKSKFKSRFKLK